MWKPLAERIEFWMEAFSFWWLGIALAWSIFSNAATIRDNFFSPERQEKWRTLRVIPKLSWHVWVIGLLMITLLATMEGAFRAWRAEHTKVLEAESANQVRFSISMDSANIYVPGEYPSSTGLLFIVRIRNSGAPSIAEDWGLWVTLPNGSLVKADPIPIGESLILTGSRPEDNKVYYGRDALYEKTATRRILTGEMATGVLPFKVDNITKDDLLKPETTFKLVVRDAWGREFSTVKKISEFANQLTYLPGLRKH